MGKGVKGRRFTGYRFIIVFRGSAFYHSGKTENVPDNYEMASEVINGFCVLNVKSEETAMMIAKTCPIIRNELASCEIREFKRTV
ncbi:MAG: YciI family protein [Chitinophagaceae bacterium]